MSEDALSFAIYKAKAASAAMAAMAEPAWSWPAAPVKVGAAGAVASGSSGATDGWTDGWTEASAPSSGLVGDGESSPLPLAMMSQILVVVWRVSAMDVKSCSARQAIERRLTDWVIALAAGEDTWGGGVGDGLDVGALALVVRDTASGAGGSGGQAGDGASWDLSNEISNGLRVGSGGEDGGDESGGELHFG